MAALALVGVVGSLPTASAEDPPRRIPWIKVLPKAFEAAKAQDRPLMICINARRVGIGRIEPAAKELRTRTYVDERVVKLARESFVCAFLTAEGTSEDYGELRVRYGISGEITSPQHIFAYPDGRLITRKEYWPHGTGESSVKALLELMEKALARDRYRRGDGETPGDTTPPDASDEGTPPTTGPGDEEAPESGPERTAWIDKRMAIVTGRDAELRKLALDQLFVADREGDCVRPLVEALADADADLFVRIDVARALGRPGLLIAAPALVDALKEKDEELRGNAAVSLEYVGSAEHAGAVQRRAAREKAPKIESHLWRAVGRCGAGDSKTRSALVKAASKASGFEASYGPIIGLAYFAKDKRAARAIEKLLVKVGPPRGGRRTNWAKAMQRALLAWCLAEIGDPGSADFMMERMIEPLENVDSRWKPRILRFYLAVVKVCQGDAEGMGDVEEGVQYYLNRVEDNPLLDDVRRGREGGEFVPKADWR